MHVVPGEFVEPYDVVLVGSPVVVVLVIAGGDCAYISYFGDCVLNTTIDNVLMLMVGFKCVPRDFVFDADEIPVISANEEFEVDGVQITVGIKGGTRAEGHSRRHSNCACTYVIRKHVLKLICVAIVKIAVRRASGHDKARGYNMANASVSARYTICSYFATTDCHVTTQEQFVTVVIFVSIVHFAYTINII